jgi:hypothetical protein
VMLFTDKHFHAVDEVVTTIDADVPDLLTSFSFGLHDGDFDLFGRHNAIHAELSNGWSGNAGREKRK